MRFPMRRITRRFALFSVCVLLVLSARLAGRDRGHDPHDAKDEESSRALSVSVWPGWRGLGAEGRVPQLLPTTWSADGGIRWKTPIPGGGHSSPIVYGDRVYLTMAETAVSGRLLVDTVRVITVGLVLALAACVATFVARQCDARRAPTTRDRVVSVAMLSATIVLAAIVSCGDVLFDYGRCNIRGWIASAGFVTTCLALTTAVTPNARRRSAVGLGAIAFAAFVAAFPSSELAFHDGWLALRTQIAVAACLVPSLFGVGVLFGGWTRIDSPVMRRRLVTGSAILAIALGLALVVHFLTDRGEGFPETPYVRHLSPWLWSVPAATLAAGWFARRLVATSPRLHLLAMWAGAFSVVLAGLLAVEALAMRAPYLSYQIGALDLAPLAGSVTLWTTGAALALIVVSTIAWTGRTRVVLSAAAVRRLATALSVAALALGASFFVRVNYVRTNSHMERAIVSLDRQSGAVAWTLRGLNGPHPPTDGRNSAATPTAVTDGRLVCAYFGTPGVMCADADGRLAWSRADLPYDGLYGVGFSLVLADGLLVIARDRPEGVAVVDALDAATGASRWTRSFATKPRLTGNSRTPIVREVDGEPVLILWGWEYVTALALRSGEPVWSYRSKSDGDMVSSATSDAERLYLSDMAGTVALDVASLAAGRDPVRWRNKARANCVSPVVVNGLLFTVSDTGIATSMRTDTGETVWQARLPGHYFASLIASPAAVYFTNSDGLTTVIAADGSFRRLAQNDVGEATLASMAIADGDLFIRSARHVYAVSRQ